MKEKEFLNSKEVSRYFDIPLRTIQKLSQQGRIRAVKLGKQWRYKKADIEEYYSLPSRPIINPSITGENQGKNEFIPG